MHVTDKTSERFLAMATVAGADECWLWTARRDNKGYGRITMGGHSSAAHRVAYELFVGPIPDGHDIDHRCHNEAVDAGSCAGGSSCPHRACVNPAHLEAVTRRINTLRSRRSTAGRNARKTHCVNGHEFTPENTYFWRGLRHCRSCRAEMDARRRRKF